MPPGAPEFMWRNDFGVAQLLIGHLALNRRGAEFGPLLVILRKNESEPPPTGRKEAL
jgi:hypothetical protein